MNSKPYDFKKLDALLAAVRDFQGCHAICTTQRVVDGGIAMYWSSPYALITIEMSGRVLAHLSPQDADHLRRAMEPNKNS